MPALKIMGKSGPALGLEINITDDQTILFGRNSKMDVRLKDDSLLSGAHFQIQQTDRHFVLTDLTSMNGTFVNQERVSTIRLLEDDIIKAGSSEFEVVLLSGGLPVGEESSFPATSSNKPSPGSGSLYYPTPADWDEQLAKAGHEPVGFIAQTAAEIIEHFDLQRGFPNPSSLDPYVSPEKYIETLTQLQKLREAIEFLSFGLGRRHAVWWACLCTRTAHHSLPEQDRLLLEAAEAWVREPKEDLRYKAMELANHTDLTSAASWVCMSAFHCGESLAPQGAPAIAIAKELVGKSVSGAILIAATESPDRDSQKLQKAFLTLGLELANGLHTWDEKPAME